MRPAPRRRNCRALRQPAGLGLRALRRTAVLVDAPGARHQVVARRDRCRRQFYFKPDAGKSPLSPADESPTPPCDARTGRTRRGHRRRPGAGVTRYRYSPRRSPLGSGLRTFAPDRVPVVGYIRTYRTCSGAPAGEYGIRRPPALARTAAALAQRNPLPQDVVDQGLIVEDIFAPAFQECQGRLKRNHGDGGVSRPGTSGLHGTYSAPRSAD